MRPDVSGEAIRLARALVVLMPDEPEAVGLLALMLLQDARRAARLDADGELVLLADQDRALWDRGMIAEGTALLDAALRRGRVGSYQLQAAIAAEHDRGPETDWREIVRLYDELLRVLPTPVVRLHRAVAVASVDGPAAALPLVEELAGELERHHLLHATRGDLLSRLDRAAEARSAYAMAVERAPSAAERRFLGRRIAALG